MFAVVSVLLAASLAIATPVSKAIGGSVAYISPALNGGSQLDASAGLGEPLNVTPVSASYSASAYDNSSPNLLREGYYLWPFEPFDSG